MKTAFCPFHAVLASVSSIFFPPSPLLPPTVFSLTPGKALFLPQCCHLLVSKGITSHFWQSTLSRGRCVAALKQHSGGMQYMHTSPFEKLPSPIIHQKQSYNLNVVHSFLMDRQFTSWHPPIRKHHKRLHSVFPRANSLTFKSNKICRVYFVLELFLFFLLLPQSVSLCVAE